MLLAACKYKMMPYYLCYSIATLATRYYTIYVATVEPRLMDTPHKQTSSESSDCPFIFEQPLNSEHSTTPYNRHFPSLVPSMYSSVVYSILRTKAEIIFMTVYAIHVNH